METLKNQPTRREKKSSEQEVPKQRYLEDILKDPEIANKIESVTSAIKEIRLKETNDEEKTAEQVQNHLFSQGFWGVKTLKNGKSSIILVDENDRGPGVQEMPDFSKKPDLSNPFWIEKFAYLKEVFEDAKCLGLLEDWVLAPPADGSCWDEIYLKATSHRKQKLLDYLLYRRVDVYMGFTSLYKKDNSKQWDYQVPWSCSPNKDVHPEEKRIFEEKKLDRNSIVPEEQLRARTVEDVVKDEAIAEKITSVDDLIKTVKIKGNDVRAYPDAYRVRAHLLSQGFSDVRIEIKRGPEYYSKNNHEIFVEIKVDLRKRGCPVTDYKELPQEPEFKSLIILKEIFYDASKKGLLDDWILTPPADGSCWDEVYVLAIEGKEKQLAEYLIHRGAKLLEIGLNPGNTDKNWTYKINWSLKSTRDKDW